MQPTLSLSILFVVPALLSAACGAEPEPELLASSESAQTSGSLEASDGPFSAWIVSYVDGAGQQRRRLALTYREPLRSSFLLCSLFPRQPSISVIFVTGPEDARTSTSRPMTVSCPTSYGDNGGQTNSATLSVAEDEDPALWDTLFPLRADGSRWFALRVAATNAYGGWDSRFGADYRLVLQPW